MDAEAALAEVAAGLPPMAAADMQAAFGLGQRPDMRPVHRQQHQNCPAMSQACRADVQGALALGQLVGWMQCCQRAGP